MAQTSRAAGLVIYRRRNNAVDYLLLQASYPPHHWTPPKDICGPHKFVVGHLDPGEDEMKAAVRETEEEAGIPASKLKIHHDFPYEMHYEVKFHGSQRFFTPKQKTVTYWPAELLNHDDVEVKLSEEHSNKAWAPLKEAKALTKFPEMSAMLDKINEYLSNA